MRIGVISDTHMQAASEELRNLDMGAFAGVPMVVHAGDLTRIAVLDAFSDKDVVAVSGNMDRHDVTDVLPAKQVVVVEGFRIGLVHGWGFARGIEDRIVETFPDVQAIIYGHTHLPANHWRDGLLLFNPGSFAGSRHRDGGRTVGILRVEKAKGIRGEIIQL